MSQTRERVKYYSIVTGIVFLVLLMPLTIVLVQKEQNVRSRAAQVAAPTGFIYREGNKLMLNGKQYQTASFNSFQLSGCGNANQVPSDAQIDTLFASLPDNIMIRMWAFPGNDSKIDKVVKAAEKHNIKMLLTLSDGRSYCGEHDGAPDGDGSGKTADWYTSGYKNTFLPHVTKMSTTYKNSAAVGMWEIINEPGDAEWPQIKTFLDEVAAEIKKNDPNHLVSSGSWAEWAYDGEANFQSMHSGPNIDVGSLHEYDYDSSNGEIESNHFAATLRAMNNLNKVLIVGETGIEAGASGCKTNEQTRAQAMKEKYDVYLSKGAGGVFAWNYAQAPDACGHTFGPTDPMMEVIKTYKANIDASGLGTPSSSPYVTPSFFPLAPCPTCSSPSISPITSTAPGPTGVDEVPIVTVINPNPTEPCEANGASIAHDRKSKHKEHNGGVSGFMEALLRFFIELINLILRLFGGGQIPLPDSNNPIPDNNNPEPCQPVEESPVEPSEPIAQPSTTVPSAGVNPSTPVPSTAIVPSQTPGTNSPTTATCTGSGTGGSLDTTGWTLSGCDDFNGTAVDTSKWGMYDGAGHGGNGKRSPSQAKVANGILTLTGLSDGTTAGMAWQGGQKYGRWEGRVKAPASDPSYNALLLLWPDAENWPVGGEVDFMEMMDETRQTTNFFLHYGADNSQVDGSVKIDGTQWHNWAVEWNATSIVGYVDGKEWFRSTDAKTLPPGPMHLTIQLDWFPEGGTVKQSEMQVDWVHIYTKN